MKYRICPRCGAHLDYGEACDCDEENSWEKLSTTYGKRLFKDIPGQLVIFIDWPEKGAKTA